MKRAFTAMLALALFGCAPDLREDFPFDGQSATGAVRVETEARGEGVFRTRIDASEKEAFVYFDLDSGEALPVDVALETQSWDVAFQRFKIITNSGVSGPGGVGTAVLEGSRFEDVTLAPESGYRADASDGPDANNDLDSAFLEGDGWYFYDFSKHRLSPRDVVYVVRTTDGAYVKLRFVAYYDEAGNSGHPQFDWAELPAP